MTKRTEITKNRTFRKSLGVFCLIIGMIAGIYGINKLYN